MKIVRVLYLYVVKGKWKLNKIEIYDKMLENYNNI